MHPQSTGHWALGLHSCRALSAQRRLTVQNKEPKGKAISRRLFCLRPTGHQSLIGSLWPIMAPYPTAAFSPLTLEFHRRQKKIVQRSPRVLIEFVDEWDRR